MKAVHIITTDFGGAFKAVQRIQDSMRLYQEESDILVRSRFFDTDTIEIINKPWQKLFSKGKNFFNLLLSYGEVITDLLGTDVSKHPKVQEADIIMLHWVNSFISGRSIKKLAKLHKPVIWVMHDMWVFTGGCHYDAYCNRYKEECGCCPYIGGRWKKDISYWNLRKKKDLFDSLNLSFIAISKWEWECALSSMPLRGKNVTYISNPLDINIFCPQDRSFLKERYGIADKKVILFGADKALENHTKGFQYLIEALRYLDGNKYIAVCFGKAPEKQRIKLEHMEIRYLGTIQDEKKIAEWYNIADVFVAPSLQEAFGYTVCEALACGTPVTAFAVGGMMDQITHRENGYLANLYDADDLAAGISFCIENRSLLGHKARKWVINHNSYEVIGAQYRGYCKDKIEENNCESSHISRW